MEFENLDLSEDILDALYDMRFEKCTPVQEHCIPAILAGKDVLGVAQTGTGKTAAYLLPVLSKLAEENYPEETINCLIMAPTRELAQQIDQAAQGFSYYLNDISCVAIYGGNDGNRYNQELKSLSMGADLVIATPGRFISHMSLGNVDLSKVSFFILDEADRMLDMGFSEDIMTIARKLPKSCQTIMFSATMPKKIEDLAKSILKNPEIIKLAVSKPAEKIDQKAYVCYEDQKITLIKDIFAQQPMQRVIVFSGSKQKVKQITASLNQQNIKCGEMHSDLEQAERDQMMFRFKSGQIDVLIATDILSRGIDIDDITMVINYDVPHDAEDYVHRIGRTARADRKGTAITFVSKDDIYAFQQIEKFLEREIEKSPLPEHLGKGPQYVTVERQRGKGRNGSRKPQHNRQEGNQPQRNERQQRQKQNNRQPAQPKTKGEITQNNPQNKDKVVAQVTENNKSNRKQKDEQLNQKPQRQKQNTASNNAPQEGKKPTQTKKKKKSARKAPKTEFVRSTKYDIRQELPQKKEKKSGLKSLIAKPLSWLNKLRGK
ncbi:MAG: DEAD/DEAH box helicase [Prevotella sp.]|nr:DEAD/DEAH box helicase [Prevotellaceae bacterium]MDY3936045.1 DEAD/DEAH box helicase [Prevotella sp.]